MRPSLSIRARLMLGALLWIGGLFLLTGVLLTQVAFWHPDTPRAFHAIFARMALVSGAGVAFLIVGFAVVRGGVVALDRLRGRLVEVHEGRERSLRGAFPAEVQPLVNDLNALLAHRERAVARAMAKAGDLAHGLKTPLAVLAQEAERAELAGAHDVAETVRQQVERMRRQVEYYLAHARAAASGATPGARCSIAESAEGLARTLRRLHAGRGIAIHVHVPEEAAVRAQREDLDEMLGNLLDNGCKWARTHVAIGLFDDGTSAAETIAIVVDDDGAGLDPSMRETVLQRGVRADEAAPGTGLGLAIVRELADIYGGTIALGESPLGGLRATLRLPRSEGPRG